MKIKLCSFQEYEVVVVLRDACMGLGGAFTLELIESRLFLNQSETENLHSCSHYELAITRLQF